MHYVPGRLRWDLLPITSLAGNMEVTRDVLTPDQSERFRTPVAIELQKGECTFHHPLMGPATSDRRRQTV